MKRSIAASCGLGIALVLLAASAAVAAPAPSSPLPAFLAAPGGGAASPLAEALAGGTTSLHAIPAQTGTCGPVRYFCQSCSTAATDQRLCSEQICGTYVILNCGDCSPRCSLPPA